MSLILNSELLTMVVLFAVIVVDLCLLVCLDQYLRGKGYKSPFRGPLTGAAFLAMSAVGVAFSINFAVATTLALALTALGARLIPRGARRAGPRRVSFPWRAVGVASLAGIPIALILWLTGMNAGGAIQLIIVSYSLYLGCLHLAKRERSKPLEQVLDEDKRPSVLYLRPFDREDVAFAAPNSEECRQLGIPFRDLYSGGRQAATFEEYFAKEVTEKLGPFIALGDPNDYLPPAGAARAYIEDDHWQQQFRLMLQRSICPDGARPFRQPAVGTLGHPVSRPSTRLFVLTSPAVGPNSFSWDKRRWQDFSMALAASGLVVGPYPGDGTTIGFDDQGREIVGGTGAQKPNEYVSIINACIAAALPAGKETGLQT